MGNQKNKRQRKMLAPVVVTILTVLYYLVYFFFLMAVLPGVWKYLLGIFPLAFSVLMIVVCKERISEIKKGEEDDLSQY